MKKCGYGKRKGWINEGGHKKTTKEKLIQMCLIM